MAKKATPERIAKFRWHVEQLKLKLKYTNERMAASLGINPGNFSRYCNSPTTPPGEAFLNKFYKLYQSDIDMLDLKPFPGIAEEGQLRYIHQTKEPKQAYQLEAEDPDYFWSNLSKIIEANQTIAKGNLAMVETGKIIAESQLILTKSNESLASNITRRRAKGGQ